MVLTRTVDGVGTTRLPVIFDGIRCDHFCYFVARADGTVFHYWMRIVTTPEEQRAYMAQWRAAAAALAEVKSEELRSLTEEEAASASHALLSLGPFPVSDERQRSSGLVEQQRIFGKWHQQH